MRDFPARNLDASLNRASEGLRVLMDLARFGLDDSRASAEFKSIRHELIQIIGSLPGKVILESRDTAGDVGRPVAETPSAPTYADESELFEANCRRVQEALRSLEETLRLVDPGKARKVETLRYRLYDLQNDLNPAVLARTHRGKMDFELYVVTDRRLAGDRPLEKVVRDAIRGGAGCIQLREKEQSTREVLDTARLLRKVTSGEGVTFIVNDTIDVALEAEADGVHLGQEDLPLEAARHIAGSRLLIGVSTHTQKQALAAQAGGAGYINIGPIFPTMTKGVPVTPVTVDLVRDLSGQLKVPFTTMGGIHLNNVGEVIQAGADRVAVVSEVIAAEDVESAARRMVEAIRRAKEERDVLQIPQS